MTMTTCSYLLVKKSHLALSGMKKDPFLEPEDRRDIREVIDFLRASSKGKEQLTGVFSAVYEVYGVSAKESIPYVLKKIMTELENMCKGKNDFQELDNLITFLDSVKKSQREIVCSKCQGPYYCDTSLTPGLGGDVLANVAMWAMLFL